MIRTSCLEIRQGLVTPEGAKNYGVIADQNGHVDVGQTESLRRNES